MVAKTPELALAQARGHTSAKNAPGVQAFEDLYEEAATPEEAVFSYAGKFAFLEAQHADHLNGPMIRMAVLTDDYDYAIRVATAALATAQRSQTSTVIKPKQAA